MKREKRAKDRLRDLNVTPTKTRGQNFLINVPFIFNILEFGQPRSGENIVEIGPGLGALTSHLSQFPGLKLIEIEEKFCQALHEKYPHVEIINRDVREVNFSELGSDLVIFGNLPYSFSTEIIFHLIEYAPFIRRAVLLLQREFAERLAAEPGGKTFGTISIAAQLHCDMRLGPIIPGNCFHPPTKVESRLIELEFLSEPRYPVSDKARFRRVVKGAFHERRKKILNSLKASGLFDPEQVAKALDAAGIDAGRRAETLSIEEFVNLSEAFGS
jgi:16S rRNA (adenine1518-N6/adenine1519-N6)-dimethyltransferase